MNRKDIETVTNLIIDEEFEQANALISKIMNEETKRIYKERLIEDGDLPSEEEEENKEDEDETSSENPEEDETSSEEDSSEKDEDATYVETSSPAAVNYQINDIQKDIARLKAEFNKIMGSEETDETEETVGEDVYDSDPSGGDDVDSPLTYANEENLDEDGSVFDDSDLNDIAESLELSTVKCDLTTPKEAGDGKSVKTDNKSFVSDKEGEKGKPIEIKSSGEPKGSGRETAPSVKDAPYKSTNTMDLKTVSKEGDSSAKINSKEGFGKEDDGDSPLSKIKN